MSAPIILSVEDSDADFLIMKMALRECLIVNDLRRVSDGEQAIAFLNSLRASSDGLRPHLVLLDVNMPRLSGFDVLRFMKSHEFTRHIPVVFFTSSGNASDQERAIALGAEEFITKPSSYTGMMELLKEVCSKYLPGSTQAANSPP